MQAQAQSLRQKKQLRGSESTSDSLQHQHQIQLKHQYKAQVQAQALEQGQGPAQGQAQGQEIDGSVLEENTTKSTGCAGDVSHEFSINGSVNFWRRAGTMKLELLVSAEIDSAGLEFHARRAGLTLPRALEALVSECEQRLAHALKSHHSIAAVGVEPLTRQRAVQ
jgi:hypothetical protein